MSTLKTLVLTYFLTLTSLCLGSTDKETRSDTTKKICEQLSHQIFYAFVNAHTYKSTDIKKLLIKPSPEEQKLFANTHNTTIPDIYTTISDIVNEHTNKCLIHLNNNLIERSLIDILEIYYVEYFPPVNHLSPLLLPLLAQGTSNPDLSISSQSTISLDLLYDKRTVFLGDSNLNGILKDLDISHGVGVANGMTFGELKKRINSSSTQTPYQESILLRQQLVQAENIIIYCAVNDYLGRGSTEYQVSYALKQLQTLINTIREHNISSRIIICNYHSVHGERKEFIDAFNTQLSVQVLGPHIIILPFDSSINIGSKDGIHPNNPKDILKGLKITK